VSRIEEGRYLYKTAMADIRELIKMSIEANKDQAKAKKVKIEFTPPDKFPMTMMDSEKIKLVIQNFIDNAIQYSEQKEKIIISLTNDDKNIQLVVKDFGIGVPKDQQPKIFTKFFRGDNATKINTHGSGLGLFLSKNIIEAHGGKIWLESEENIGTSLYFSLPIKKI
jgi:signal transduction histidine kinase